jgi:hypothetical protein
MEQHVIMNLLCAVQDLSAIQESASSVKIYSWNALSVMETAVLTAMAKRLVVFQIFQIAVLTSHFTDLLQHVNSMKTVAKGNVTLSQAIAVK